MYQIQQTKDYGKFKKMKGNRTVTRGQINNVKKSIEKDNQLNLHPIIVNEDWEVIDGQTRLIAAEELGVPIFYIKSDDVEYMHFIYGNLNQKKLSIQDYINFYAINKKNAEYQELMKNFKMVNLNCRAFLYLYLGECREVTLDAMKNGTYKKDPDKAKSYVIDLYNIFFDYVTERRIKPFSMFKSAHFAQAFRWLIMTTGFSMDVFMSKVESRWTELKPFTSSLHWYKILVDIYNWKNNKKLDLEFIEE